MVRLTTRLPAFGLQVVRCFEDEDVHHVNGKVDPAEDAETINFELALADVAQIEKRLERLKKGRAKTKEEQASNEVTLHLSMQLSCPSAGVARRQYLQHSVASAQNSLLFVAALHQHVPYLITCSINKTTYPEYCSNFAMHGSHRAPSVQFI